MREAGILWNSGEMMELWHAGSQELEISGIRDCWDFGNSRTQEL